MAKGLKERIYVIALKKINAEIFFFLIHSFNITSTSTTTIIIIATVCILFVTLYLLTSIIGLDLTG